ncbi:MAG: DUF4446 family protein [[Ruminococcus] gnavus]|nr:DUF4446 family protein [Mediterraneibacter gnavus]
MATEIIGYLVIVLLILQVIFIGIVINLQMKYKRMQEKYQIFMRGKDGRSLERGFLEQFKTVEKLERIAKQNTRDIDMICKKMRSHYQKVGIVRYDAFQEMGGDLSFVLTMLDENNSGWILNAIHSREGCYTYIKEIVKGECDMELGREERESLKKAMKQ